MNIFWKKYKEYAILIIVPVILGVISAFIISYLAGEISAKNDSIEREIIDHEEREKRLKEISSLEKQFEMIEKEKSKLEVFVSRDQIITLIKKLEETAEETGNEAAIEEVEIQDENSKKELKNKSAAGGAGKDKKEFSFPSDNYIKVKVSLRGSYNDAVNFIRKIENMNYCSDIIFFQLLVEKNELAGQLSGSYSKKSGFLVGKNPSIKNSKGEIATRESTGEALIKSVLEIVFYLNE